MSVNSKDIDQEKKRRHCAAAALWCEFKDSNSSDLRFDGWGTEVKKELFLKDWLNWMIP